MSMLNWIDQSVLHTLISWHTLPGLYLFVIITQLGNWMTVLGVVLSTSLALWLKKEWHYILPLWLTVAGAGLSSLLAKLLFQRPRPELAVYIEPTLSFPSGHATVAVALWGFLIYLLIHHSTQQYQKTLAWILGILLIVAIGFSRLYLGVHFLTDVLGGYLLGLLWLIIGLRLANISHFHRKA